MIFRRIRAVILLIILIFIGVKIFQGSSIIGSVLEEKDIIVIDPGHGGNDPGTIGINNIYEKDINLDIAKKLSKKLKSMNYKVILTRDTDEYIDNTERADLANRKRARLFVSIHCNALENNTTVNGVQVLYYPDKDSNKDLGNETLAQMVLDEILINTGADNKGIVEREDLIVLNQTKVSAIIIECGFLTNEKEANLLLTDKYQNKIANAIAEGVKTYLNY
ncbi:N-acetylmuramoyl-L-alanine amidase [Tissierella praeacuta]|uniref:N-acetylmuramoyl-L-alanine amidase family protein n=1 Tax=Tissierella praeacuta TaxID=43131 RepID=UPI0033406B25